MMLFPTTKGKYHIPPGASSQLPLVLALASPLASSQLAPLHTLLRAHGERVSTHGTLRWSRAEDAGGRGESTADRGPTASADPPQLHHFPPPQDPAPMPKWSSSYGTVADVACSPSHLVFRQCVPETHDPVPAREPPLESFPHAPSPSSAAQRVRVRLAEIVLGIRGHSQADLPGVDDPAGERKGILHDQCLARLGNIVTVPGIDARIWHLSLVPSPGERERGGFLAYRGGPTMASGGFTRESPVMG